jgi:hypothetical protein
MMVSLVKGLERGLLSEEGIFSNGAKDLLSKEKTIFRKLRAPFFSSPWPDSLRLFWPKGQGSALFLENICRLDTPFRFTSKFLKKERKGSPSAKFRSFFYGAIKRSSFRVSFA